MNDDPLNAVGYALHSCRGRINANSNKNDNVELDAFEINAISQQQANFAIA